MILQEATYFKYGYYPSALKSKSNKKILAACDECGKVRAISKSDYHALCGSCAKKGKTHTVTEEAKRKIGEGNKGKTITPETKCKIGEGNKGKTVSDETKRKLSDAKKGKTGDKCSAWKGGAKLSWARGHAKRKGLGFDPINASFEGAEGHHITHNFVMYIPKVLHRSMYHNMHTGRNIVAVNALALSFLLEGF